MIKEIANSLNVELSWDYVATIIAIISLALAGISLAYTILTLKSQRQTEANTTRIMKPEIQEFLLKEILLKVFDGYIRLSTLKRLYEDTEFKSYVSEEKMTDLKIETSNIHADLFYSNSDNWRCMQGLSDMIDAFNSRIDVCVEHFKNPKINHKFLANEVERLINIEANIVSTWSKVMSLVYGYHNNIEEQKVIDYVVNKMDVSNFEAEIQDSFFVDNNIFAKYYDENPEGQKRLLVFMNQFSRGIYNDFANLLIER